MQKYAPQVNNNRVNLIWALDTNTVQFYQTNRHRWSRFFAKLQKSNCAGVKLYGLAPPKMSFCSHVAISASRSLWRRAWQTESSYHPLCISPLHPPTPTTGDNYWRMKIYYAQDYPLYLLPAVSQRKKVKSQKYLKFWNFEMLQNFEFAKVVEKYPKEIYAAVVRAIQSGWIFLQHITWDTGELFAGVEKLIRETFLPRLFFGKTKTLSPVVRALSTMPVKKARLGILNPLISAQDKYLISTRGRTELKRAVTGGGELFNAGHLHTLSEEQCDRKKDRNVAYNSWLKGLVSDLKGTDKRVLICAKTTGAWMSVRGNTVSGTVLSAT